MSTVEATRRASFAELVQRTLGFLDEMLRLGTTSCEAKSGYGLTLESEIKQLEVIQAVSYTQDVYKRQRLYRKQLHFVFVLDS